MFTPVNQYFGGFELIGYGSVFGLGGHLNRFGGSVFSLNIFIRTPPETRISTAIIYFFCMISIHAYIWLYPPLDYITQTYLEGLSLYGEKARRLKPIWAVWSIGGRPTWPIFCNWKIMSMFAIVACTWCNGSHTKLGSCSFGSWGTIASFYWFLLVVPGKSSNIEVYILVK